LLVIGVSTLCGILTVSLGAQSLPTRFNVPFEFSVSGKTTMPAGEYSVRTLDGNGLLEIQAADGGKTAFTLTHNGGTSALRDSAKLAFHRYGKQYFLAEYSERGSQNECYELPESKAEREAVKIASARTLETVTLVAMR
jgi:hypothetical protein